MDSLVVEPPPGAARWCAELAVSITKCFATLTKELRTESRDTTLSIQNIDSKFDALQGRPQDLGGGGQEIFISDL